MRVLNEISERIYIDPIKVNAALMFVFVVIAAAIIEACREYSKMHSADIKPCSILSRPWNNYYHQKGVFMAQHSYWNLPKGTPI